MQAGNVYYFVSCSEPEGSVSTPSKGVINSVDFIAMSEVPLVGIVPSAMSTVSTFVLRVTFHSIVTPSRAVVAKIFAFRIARRTEISVNTIP
jgi:hypothetical protein